MPEQALIILLRNSFRNHLFLWQWTQNSDYSITAFYFHQSKPFSFLMNASFQINNCTLLFKKGKGLIWFYLYFDIVNRFMTVSGCGCESSDWAKKNTQSASVETLEPYCFWARSVWPFELGSRLLRFTKNICLPMP